MEVTDVKHIVQKHILSILTKQKFARFRDMRPPRTDTNLYSYHLNQLVKTEMVKKTDDGYTLDTLGLIYADRLSSDNAYQPRVVAMFVIQNSDGDILLQRQHGQPYIDTWTLPSSNLYSTDSSLLAAARRIAYERLKLLQQDIKHAGDCYIRVYYGDTPLTVTSAHIFAFNSDDIEITDQFLWVQPHKLHSLDLTPGIEEIIARTFFRDPFFFEEYSREW